MIGTRAVLDVGFDVGTARIHATDPRNDLFPWRALAEFAYNGTPTPELPAELWLNRGQPTDAIGFEAKPAFFVSARLRDLLEEVAAGDVEVHPQSVDAGGQKMWLLRIVRVLDALDMEASDVTVDPNGQIRLLNYPVWKRAALDGAAAAFRIPQRRGKQFVTDRVASAYLASGYTGLLVGGPYGDIA